MHISRHNDPLLEGYQYPVGRREIRAALGSAGGDRLTVYFARHRSSGGMRILQAHFVGESRSNYGTSWGGFIHVWIHEVHEDSRELAHFLTVREVLPKLHDWVLGIAIKGNTWRGVNHWLEFDMTDTALSMREYDGEMRPRGRRLSSHWQLWPSVVRVA